MDATLTSAANFKYQTAVPPRRTLDDLRIVHDDYATSGSFSAKALRPVLIIMVVAAAAGGIAMGLNPYSDDNAQKTGAAIIAPDSSVPPASSVSATSNLQVPAATTATDSPATAPLTSLTKAEESNSMPMAGHGNNHSSESLNPVKAKSSTLAKPVPTTAKRIAPEPALTPELAPLPPIEIVPPPEAIVPPAPVPAPPAIQEPPVIPAPGPISPPAEPPRQ